ncbi:hypothetical protein J2Z76_000136 [Sedimentibacter acidaminivorans]|uniref:Uncharacterized protein n=1 Tax=Sedimentibacter acidaminivorans TaxID=913099 RepID=A0ABS4G9B9_9FIRM|nr:hypothetical protein [Sedimentibacter acidaminivorans]
METLNAVNVHAYDNITAKAGLIASQKYED